MAEQIYLPTRYKLASRLNRFSKQFFNLTDFLTTRYLGKPTGTADEGKAILADAQGNPVWVDVTGHNIQYTIPTDLTQTGDYKGTVIYEGSDTLVEGKVYALSAGTWTLADKDTEALATSLVGIALGTNSGTDGLLIEGIYQFASDPGDSVGEPLYIASAGDLSDDLTSTAGEFNRPVGYNLGGGKIRFAPSGSSVQITP
jgi:hypothetical protein